MNFIESHAIPKAMSATYVKKATLEDDTLQRVIENLLKGLWNEHPRKVDIDTLKALLNSSRGNDANNPEEISGQSCRTGASGSPGDSENKTSDQKRCGSLG